MENLSKFALLIWLQDMSYYSRFLANQNSFDWHKHVKCIVACDKCCTNKSRTMHEIRKQMRKQHSCLTIAKKERNRQWVLCVGKKNGEVFVENHHMRVRSSVCYNMLSFLPNARLGWCAECCTSAGSQLMCACMCAKEPTVYWFDGINKKTGSAP